MRLILELFAQLVTAVISIPILLQLRRANFQMALTMSSGSSVKTMKMEMVENGSQIGQSVVWPTLLATLYSMKESLLNLIVPLTQCRLYSTNIQHRKTKE